MKILHCVFAALVCCETAFALEPDKLLEKVAPSMVGVRALDGDEKPIRFGGGVVMAPGEVMTNCHLLDQAKSVQVRYQDLIYLATLQFSNAGRDLCQLSVPKLTAPPVTLGNVKTLWLGDRVYALRSSQVAAVSLAEGLVSALRDHEGMPVIQTTAIVSQGVSGAALFDSEGRLIGITYVLLKDMPGANFAIGVDAIQETVRRRTEALERAAKGQRPPPAIVVGGRVERPDIRVGDQWKYRVTDGYTDETRSITAEVVAVTENEIRTRNAQMPSVATDASSTGGMLEVWDHNWNLLRQGEVDYAPYYPSMQFPLESGKTWSGTVSINVEGNDQLIHEVEGQVAGWERVTVPAGTFDAVRINLRGDYRIDSPTLRGGGSISDVVWYAPALRQVIKKELQRRSFVPAGSIGLGGLRFQQLERWELVEYRLD